MGKNLLSFLEIIKYSTCLLLILDVTFLCLISKVKFLMHMRAMLTERAQIGKEISIWLYSWEFRIKKNNMMANMFSK